MSNIDELLEPLPAGKSPAGKLEPRPVADDQEPDAIDALIATATSTFREALAHLPKAS